MSLTAQAIKQAAARRPAVWLEVGEFSFETRSLTMQEIARIQRESYEYRVVRDEAGQSVVHEVFNPEKSLAGYIAELTNWRGVQLRHLTDQDVPGASPTDAAPFDRELVPMLVANVPSLWRGISDAFAAESVRYAAQLVNVSKNSSSGSDTTKT